MRGQNYWPGYPRSNPAYDTRTLEATESMMWGTGFLQPTNLGIGAIATGKADLTRRHCFATVLQGQARPISGNRDEISRPKKHPQDGISDESKY